MASLDLGTGIRVLILLMNLSVLGPMAKILHVVNGA